MRVLFISHYFYPEGNAPASRVYEMAKRWVAAGHRVTVVTGVPNVPNGVVYEGYRNRLLQREVVDGIDVVRVWTYLAANKGTARRTLNYLSFMLAATVAGLFVKRPDIVVATSPQFFCGWAGVLVSKMRRLPFILEIRDIWPESIVAVGADLPARLIKALEWLELKMYQAADHIVTVGEGYRRRLLEKGVPAAKTSVVMNGVDAEKFQPQSPPGALADKWQINGRFVCSYCGTIGMACGLQVVLDAARELLRRQITDVVFLLIGDGACRETLQRQAQEENLGNVIFTGRQPKELMPGFLELSDVSLVHLRKTDLFTTVMPSKIFEAAGMGRPIINGVPGFAAEFIEKSGAGVNIEPENADQLVQTLLSLKEDEGAREKMGRTGRQYVLRHYDRTELALEYLRIIEGVSTGQPFTE